MAAVAALDEWLADLRCPLTLIRDLREERVSDTEFGSRKAFTAIRPEH